MDAPKAKRILISRLRFIGDVVLTTPVIRALKRHYAEAELYYLAEAGPAAVLARNPYLEEVIALPDELLPGRSVLTRCGEQLRFLRDLRKRRFDLVIDLFGNPRSALLTLATGARLRVGYDVRGRGAAYNVKIRRSDALRVVDAYLDAVRTIGVPVEDDHTEVHFSAEDAAWADSWLAERDVDGDRRIAALNPGASWPAKTWSAGRFAELARRMIEALNLRVLLVAGPGQREAMAGLADMAGHACPVVETASLTRLAALIRRCDLFVSNDCGPMHIAAAVGTPTIGLFGPSNPRIWFPYSQAEGHVALEAGADDCCGRDFCVRPVPCIESISPCQVLEAVESVLRGTSNRPAE
ncbi:MAG: glycosyltransferase family 9 protein [Gemmatimonadota bacterium]|nr:glycosyltransferase family 9 protein [Gemmatimonadota bacterium]